MGHCHVFVKRQVVEVTEEEGVRAIGELSHSSGLKLPSRVIVGVEIGADVAKIVVGVSVGEVDSLDIASNNSSGGDLVVAHDLGGDEGNDTPSDIVGGGGIQPPPREERAKLLVEVGWATGVHEVDDIIGEREKRDSLDFLEEGAGEATGFCGTKRVDIEEAEVRKLIAAAAGAARRGVADVGSNH